ncbi:hypothetical protein CROQUDRAFT_42017 [Cronartium quercuum f. sp. fusiforme G11]|uniref:Phenol 2-monooxygenase n=1 Tax=Cronartium quercuum f. sp. fusiforme G11 TaxID=708437 RepID=A0A9P6NL69_9BASI|nr:hypothetical protein CROQUDRAFT_42017 [Cronartium quercuum f. sp. fusiforme G11]
MNKSQRYTDVLVIGAGPAGLMASLCFRTFHFEVHHIDDRPEPTATGRADGIQPRTLEVFRNIGSCGLIQNSLVSAGLTTNKENSVSNNGLVSLGVAKQLISLGVRVYKVAFWDPTPSLALARTSQARSCPDFVDVQDRYTLLIHQGMIERELMREISSRMAHSHHPLHNSSSGGGPETGGVDRPARFVRCRVLDGSEAGDYPVECVIERDGVEEMMRSKYVIGCDGARSSVRKSIGKDRVELSGRESEACWGVMDCVVESDFPDLKLKCLIHSRNAGSIMVIPRERNLVRFYVQLRLEGSSEPDSHSQAQHVQRDQATLEICQDRARKIFEPYKLEFKHVDWFSVYQIGQRIANQYAFDGGRIILGGDAVHTHSPKAGQGMNISMLDMYSLAWKLNLIEKGVGNRERLIETYEHERRGVALELLAFDAQYASLFSGHGASDKGPVEIDPEVFIEMFKKNAYFTTGCGAIYKANVLNITPSRKSWRLEPGARLLPGRITRLHDGNPVRIEQVVPMDGTFRIHIFLGQQAGISEARLVRLRSRFAPAQHVSPVSVFHAPKDSFFSFLVISLPTDQWELEKIPTPLRELVGDHRLFTDDLPNAVAGTPGAISLHQKFGVEEMVGGLVVVRPDGVVGCLADGSEEAAWEELEAYFDGFLVSSPVISS